jgi:multiple antibiotic resistance protein
MDLAYLKTAFVTMFVAVDPPGLAPIFLALTVGMSKANRRITARQATIIASFILVAVAVGGEATLKLLGITMPAFRIAGGLLLFYIAAEMVLERRQQRKENTAENVLENNPKHIAAFPLAIPLMAGPGAITATILQASQARGPLDYLGLMLCILVITGSCWLVFLAAGGIDRLLGNTGNIVLQRILGLLFAALAIQILGDGIAAFVQAVSAS